jgi:hypothetical protein
MAFEGQLERSRDQDVALQFHVCQHKRMMTFSWWVPIKLQLLDVVVVQCIQGPPPINPVVTVPNSS